MTDPTLFPNGVARCSPASLRRRVASSLCTAVRPTPNQGRAVVYMPKISVIIPCHCASATLPSAVLSVLAQDFADVEVLVVDDGSTDGTATIARRLAVEDARLRVIVQPEQGLAAARNRGIKESYGELIAFLDVDDRWEPDFLRRHLLAFAEQPPSGVSLSRVRFRDPATGIGHVSAPVRALSLARLLGDTPVCTASNLVARRSVFNEVGGFDSSLAHDVHQEWVARVLATTAWQVRGVPHILVECRTRAPGIAPDLEIARERWMTILRRVRGYAPGPVARVEAEASALFHLGLARLAARTGHGRRSLRPLLLALRASPRALLRQPHRTALAIAGVLATLLPGQSARTLPNS